MVLTQAREKGTALMQELHAKISQRGTLLVIILLVMFLVFQLRNANTRGIVGPVLQCEAKLTGTTGHGAVRGGSPLPWLTATPQTGQGQKTSTVQSSSFQIQRYTVYFFLDE